MKKLLLSVLAITGLVACTKSDVIEMPQNQAIKFGSAFVDNSTKAIDPSWNYTAENASFKVWGKLQPAGDNTVSTNIFNGVDVVRGATGIGDTWAYSSENVQYWIPTVNYNFAAIAGTIASSGVTMSDNLPATIPYDVSTQSDLLYASAEATGAVSGNQEIKFTFEHLLSRAQFKFVNAYPAASNLYIEVTGIKIVNPYKEGTYTINTKSWSASANSNYNLEFGNGVDANAKTSNSAAIKVGSNSASYSNNIGLLVPAKYDDDANTNDIPTLNISFTVNVYLKQKNASNEDIYTKIDALTQDYTTNYLVPNATLEFKPNCSYNFTITVGENDLEPIKFSVKEVTGWEPTTPDTSIGI